MKYLERYLGTTYRNSCQPVITAKAPAELPHPEMTTIMTETGAEHPKTDANMTYLE